MEDDNSFFDRIGTGIPLGASQAAQQRAAVPSDPLFELAVPAPQSSDAQLPRATLVRRWNKADDIFWPASETVEALAPGFYKFDHVPNVGPVVRRVSIALDGLIRLPDAETTNVLAEFQQFWTLRERFASRGYLHKRGYLLWGPPGSGKTAGLMQMSADIIEQHGGIVCQIENPDLASHCLGMIRKIEPDRPIVALIEDLDALVARYTDNHFLALLDGEAQVDRICYVATTNYPERLDRRFVDRPSRFDTIRYVGMPSRPARRLYLSVKEPSLTESELGDWVEQTDGFSVAHLRELVILVKCFDRPLADAVKRLDRMRVKTPTSDDTPDTPAFGFGRG